MEKPQGFINLNKCPMTQKNNMHIAKKKNPDCIFTDMERILQNTVK